MKSKLTNEMLKNADIKKVVKLEAFLEGLDDFDYEKYEAIMEKGIYTDFEDIYNLIYTFDEWEIFWEAKCLGSLGYEYAEFTDLSLPFGFDYEALGDGVDIKLHGYFTTHGYLFRTERL